PRPLTYFRAPPPEDRGGPRNVRGPAVSGLPTDLGPPADSNCGPVTVTSAPRRDDGVPARTPNDVVRGPAVSGLPTELGARAGTGETSAGATGPILWRFKFPDDVAARLVSWSNPSGSITNSDLELAGVLGNNMILAQETDLTEQTSATGTDNLPALSWTTKQAVSSTGPASYLLRL
ncbi:hypothetical protein THAOC_25793, partial [Thalassiosira oceanica]